MDAPHLVTLVHVVAGTLVLAVAPAAMIVRKGGRWHRRWGIAFMAAMRSAGSTRPWGVEGRKVTSMLRRSSDSAA